MEFLETIISNFNNADDLRNFAPFGERYKPSLRVENNKLFFFDEILIKVEFYDDSREKKSELIGKFPDQLLIEYWENGNTKVVGELFQGRRHGFVRKWFENGNIRAEGEYANGLQEGEWIHWWPEGQQWSHGEYLHGLQTGLLHLWDVNGIPQPDRIYQNGYEVL